MAVQSVGLKTAIWNNNLKSFALLALYPFIILALSWVIAFAGHYTMTYGATDNVNNALGAPSSAATEFLAATWPLIFTGVGIWFMVAYFFHAKMIRMMSHAHPVTRTEEPEIYNLLENLCISRGLPTPKLEIIETRARNAFASGINQKTYSITVTRGLLQSLQKDEIEAVLAHELTHIMNNDVRLLVISIIFTGLIGFLAQMTWSSIRLNTYRSRRKRDGRAMVFLFAVLVILWIGYIATLFTRFAISRRREYMADAGAVELTKNPEAMMRALMRIAGKDNIPEVTGDIDMMCIENSQALLGAFATHPPIDRRIKAIAEMTQTPVPEIARGHRAENDQRFLSPEENREDWLTRKRKIRDNPWTR